MKRNKYPLKRNLRCCQQKIPNIRMVNSEKEAKQGTDQSVNKTKPQMFFQES